MTRIDYAHLINRFSFWLLVLAVIIFTMSPFVYALSISFRTNPQVLIEARYLPEASNFERQYNLDRIQIIEVNDPGGSTEHIELQNIGSRSLNLNGWRITSSATYEAPIIQNVYDPTQTEQNFLGLSEVLSDRETISLRGIRALDDVAVVFVATQRTFPPDTVAIPSQPPIHTVSIPRFREIERWNNINNIRFEFDVILEYFTRFQFPDIQLSGGETLLVYTGEGTNTDTEIYMGYPFVPLRGNVFSGRLWDIEGTTITLNNNRSISEATFITGSDRIERIQIVNQAELGTIRYDNFADFFGDGALDGDRLSVFLAQFGGTTDPAEIFEGVESINAITSAIENYAEMDAGFDSNAALSLIENLAETRSADEFSAQLLAVGFEEDFINPLIDDATRITGERVDIQHFGRIPVDLEGWRISNTQNTRARFDLPAFTLQPDTVVTVVTGWGLNTDEVLFLNNNGSIWQEKQVANLTDATGLRRSSYIVGGEVYALRNYTNLIEDETFLRNLWNSAIIATVSVTLSLIVGSFAAYALGRIRFRGQYIILYLVLAMTMFPQISILSGMFKIVNNLDIYNTNLAMIFSYPLFTLPFTVWVLTSFFKGLPSEIEQAALVDGATAFQTFWRILVPLTAPALVTTGLLAFIAAWNEYLFALTFTLGEENRTVPVAIAQFSGFDREEATADKIAAAVIVTIPLLVMVLVFQRRIVEGLTAGAVKG